MVYKFCYCVIAFLLSVLLSVNQNATFEITDTKFYVKVETLSTQDNSKLLQQLKSGFKCVISWNKYM